MPPKYIGALVIAVLAVSVVSIGWPKFTSQPRPPLLIQVRDVAITTWPGQEIANVLGISDESKVEHVSIGEFVAGQAKNAFSSVTKSVQQSVTTNLLTSLASKFQELPEDQKNTFRSMICLPDDAPTE